MHIRYIKFLISLDANYIVFFKCLIEIFSLNLKFSISTMKFVQFRRTLSESTFEKPHISSINLFWIFNRSFQSHRTFIRNFPFIRQTHDFHEHFPNSHSKNQTHLIVEILMAAHPVERHPNDTVAIRPNPALNSENGWTSRRQKDHHHDHHQRCPGAKLVTIRRPGGTRQALYDWPTFPHTNTLICTRGWSSSGWVTLRPGVQPSVDGGHGRGSRSLLTPPAHKINISLNLSGQFVISFIISYSDIRRYYVFFRARLCRFDVGCVCGVCVCVF